MDKKNISQVKGLPNLRSSAVKPSSTERETQKARLAEQDGIGITNDKPKKDTKSIEGKMAIEKTDAVKAKKDSRKKVEVNAKGMTDAKRKSSKPNAKKDIEQTGKTMIGRAEAQGAKSSKQDVKTRKGSQVKPKSDGKAKMEEKPKHKTPENPPSSPQNEQKRKSSHTTAVEKALQQSRSTIENEAMEQEDYRAPTIIRTPMTYRQVIAPPANCRQAIVCREAMLCRDSTKPQCIVRRKKQTNFFLSILSPNMLDFTGWNMDTSDRVLKIKCKKPKNYAIDEDSGWDLKGSAEEERLLGSFALLFIWSLFVSISGQMIRWR